MRKVYIITQNDLVYYPPTQTLILLMLKRNAEVHFVGRFSDPVAKEEFEKEGVTFHDLILNEEGNFLTKFIRQRNFSRSIKSLFEQERLGKTDLIWYIYSGATVCCLSKVLERYNYVVHFYEFFNALQSWRYRIIYPYYTLSAFLQKANGVIHCEYNRAQICRCIYGLETMPYIIPNKPYINQKKQVEYPDDISLIKNDIQARVNGRKIIIYQGYFNAKERRLEEFCQAMDMISPDHVLVIMGKGSSYFDNLKEKYESDKIIFVPFIRPPYHLAITRLATIGILTYHPQVQTYPGVINPLYCAPNKIYEYGKYGIPMLGNDIPGLKYLFKEYNCGETISYPITPKKIADEIVRIEKYYKQYSDGSKNLYDSCDIEGVISDILNNVVPEKA